MYYENSTQVHRNVGSYTCDLAVWGDMRRVRYSLPKIGTLVNTLKLFRLLLHARDDEE